MKNGIDGLMKQAQKMQEKMQKMQQEVINTEVTGEAGAGLVQVRMNGQHDVLQVKVDASLLAEEKEMLEDLLGAACNDANRKIELMTKEKMGDIGSALNLPNGLNLPF